MKLEKVVAGFLSVTLLACSAVPALAMGADEVRLISAQEQTEEVIPISAPNETVKRSYYNAFSGTVKSVTDYKGIAGAKFVSVESAEGAPANFIVTEDTYIVNSAEITVGAGITGFYEANAMMIMIYPPQYPIKVVAVGDLGYSLKVDLFDQDLLSADNKVKVELTDETELITADGQTFHGQLANRKLVVMYKVARESLPEQATAEKIVVLPEEETKDVAELEIIVNQNKIEAPEAYQDEEGIIMVPLRAIAQALGFDVTWDGELQKIVVGQSISLAIGKNAYTTLQNTVLQLGTAPVIVQDKTFVPLDFFSQVMGLPKAYVGETQIVIDGAPSKL